MNAESEDRSESGKKTGSPSLAEIIDVVRPHVEKIEEGFKAIRITLDALSEHVGGAAASPPAEEAVDETPEPPAAKPTADDDPAPSTAPPAKEPKAAPVETAPVVAARPTPVEPPPAQPVPAPIAIPVTGGGDGGNWSQIIFGEYLTVDPSISHLSGTLLADVHVGDNDAVGLMGHLLDFRSATGERKPRMLKDVGEAFYRWKPTDDTTLRDALIVWIHAQLDAVGINNRIEIVQVGDRYDMQRHNAKERGIEVGDVYGWIVLRENGKVYSKASVSVR
ncbi:MAG: hypothetical protein H8E44_32240 [Planctomycetes bacterium]|nr:hypothetical protein [Planctomycetota bacterium]MBL7038080.1 hypothetical protein [Pirellulaceae bacterium]